MVRLGARVHICSSPPRHAAWPKLRDGVSHGACKCMQQATSPARLRRSTSRPLHSAAQAHPKGDGTSSFTSTWASTTSALPRPCWASFQLTCSFGPNGGTAKRVYHLAINDELPPVAASGLHALASSIFARMCVFERGPQVCRFIPTHSLPRRRPPCTQLSTSSVEIAPTGTPRLLWYSNQQR